MNRIPWLLSALLALLLVIASILAIRARGAASSRQASVHFQRDFCLRVGLAMTKDRVAFASEDPRARAEALERFYESSVVFHGTESIKYCVDKLPEMPLGCRLGPDWDCLQRIATELDESVRGRWN